MTSPVSENPPALNGEQMFLLKWLSREDWSRVGECKGVSLDYLIEKGLAEYGAPSSRGDDFRAVRLTRTGFDHLLSARKGASS